MDECKEFPDFFYDVAVGSPAAKKSAVFTYASSKELKIGELVLVPLRKKEVLGFVVSESVKPTYETKQISENYQITLPESHLSVSKWANQFYPFHTGAMQRLFCPPASPTKRKAAEELLATINLDTNKPPMTNEQQIAVKTILSHTGSVVLHGETGSGKTRVYEETARQVLESGKSVVILTPEIGLSEQLQSTLHNSFADLITYHSMLSLAKRRDIWYGLASSSKPQIIIGPRSAIFLPIKNIGLIIIDEAHDSSYKNQQAPYYSAIQVAAAFANIVQCPLVYGSATPNTSDYFSAISKNSPVIRMQERPVQSRSKVAAPEFHLISTREPSYFRQSRVLSTPVIDRIRRSSSQGRQSLLLLNRRGTAQLMRCEVCGLDVACEVCSHALVYHKDVHAAICHICNRNYPVPLACVDCGGGIRMLVIGTKHIEEECRRLFPDTEVLRVDSDSLEKEDIKVLLERMKSGHASIMVGTQVIAKGLDLPFLDTVVVVDAARQSSDYLSDERYYQLVHQIIGRGSRGHQTTEIYIQTNDIADRVLQWSKSENWQAFYEHELLDRQTYGYPPFRFIAAAYFEKAVLETAEKSVEAFKKRLFESNIRVETLGPLRDYRRPSRRPTWRVLLRATRRQDIIKAGFLAPSDWLIDLEPTNV